jgi:hypothetical protein
MAAWRNLVDSIYDGGMSKLVKETDLKSVGYCSLTGSSPVTPTTLKKL